MGWKQFVAGYLTFTRKDRAAVLALSFLLFIAAILPLLAPAGNEVPQPIESDLRNVVDSLASTAKEKKGGGENYSAYAFEPADKGYDPNTGELFYFDPNLLDDAGWRRLGLPEKTIRTINNYRNKGGHFYKPQDLAKIWGLPPGFYDHVKGHVKIAGRENRYEQKPYSETPSVQPKAAPALLDINTADTSDLIALPGIGSKLAGRIVNFRSKLGGFVSVAQFGETYGLPDSTFQKIRNRLTANTAAVQRINLNTATKEILSAHPYINWKLANAIVAYREQHGPFNATEDLQHIMILEAPVLEKLLPYLAVQ